MTKEEMNLMPYPARPLPPSQPWRKAENDSPEVVQEAKRRQLCNNGVGINLRQSDDSNDRSNS